MLIYVHLLVPVPQPEYRILRFQFYQSVVTANWAASVELIVTLGMQIAANLCVSEQIAGYASVRTIP